MVHRTPFALSLLLLVACGEDAPAAAPPPEPAPPVEQELPEPPTRDAPTYGQQRMHDRYDAIEAIRDALVRGDRDVARAVARGMDRPVGVGHLPEAAHALSDVVPERAARVAAATDDDLLLRYAELVAGCGECHAAAGITWRYDDAPPPPDGDLPAHMRRHEWAVERMWQGLVVADRDRFVVGARALEASPLVAGDAEEEDPPGLGAVAERIHARARDARDASDLAARVRVYADILEGCATCHARIEQHDAEGAPSLDGPAAGPTP